MDESSPIKLEMLSGPRSDKLVLKLVSIGVLLVLSLGIYLFASPQHSTPQERINHLETIIKCPTCISVSTKDANSASAFALRSFISKMVHQGASDSEIIDQLTITYGPSILLVPPNSSGGTYLTIASFVLALGLPVGGIAYYRRRQSPIANRVGKGDWTPTLDPTFELSEAGVGPQSNRSDPEKRSFISLEARSLKPRLAALSKVERAVGALGVLLISSGFLLLGYGLFDHSSAAALSESELTNQINVGEQLASIGSDIQALAVFGSILKSDPSQPVALSWNGWLIREAGRKDKSSVLINAGLVQMTRAVKEDPNYLYGRLFLGLALYQDRHDISGALSQLRYYLRLSPSVALNAGVRSQVDAVFEAAHLAGPIK